MPCGISKTLTNGTVLVCDNPGTSVHEGQHSAPYNFFGLTIKAYWSGGAVPEVTVAAYKRPLLGVRARDDQAWLVPSAPAVLTRAGMDKAGTWTIPGAWARPPGWTIRSGFPDTEIEGDSLVMNGPGNIRISYRGGHNSGGFGYTITKRVLKNGTVLHSNSTIDTVHTVDTSVVAGDLIWCEYQRTGGFGGSSTLLAGASETFLLVDAI